MSDLVLRDVEVEYHARGRWPTRAVAGVDLQVRPGEVVGLVGESGCGKSSLARVAAGLSAPSAGEVTFGGQRVAPLGWRRRPAEQTRLQMIFQDPGGSLNPRRTVGAQILDGVTTVVRRGASASPSCSSASACRRPPPSAFRTSSRAGSASGWPSLGRWLPTRS